MGRGVMQDIQFFIDKINKNCAGCKTGLAHRIIDSVMPLLVGRLPILKKHVNHIDSCEGYGTGVTHRQPPVSNGVKSEIRHAEPSVWGTSARG